jgi:hypothetical protein
MKHLITALAGALMLLACACGRGEKASDGQHLREPEPVGSVDRDTATQNRINSFFYAALVPKLQSCWSRVQGKGEVSFKYTYRRDGTNWRWQQQEVENTTLPPQQAEISQRCMQDAARESSFPMEAAEADRKLSEMVIHWTWPVPFPSNPAVMGMMISTGGGGGSCKETCSVCSCSFTPGVGTSCTCAMGCSGYTSCTLDADQKGCRLSGDKCASGRMGFGAPSFIALKESP